MRASSRPQWRMLVCLLVTTAFPCAAELHSADTNKDAAINLSEVLRVIQFYNSDGFHCDTETEDGFSVGLGDRSCSLHQSDYSPANWSINLTELLRLVQIYNLQGYGCDNATEDGYVPGSGAGNDCMAEVAAGSIAGYVASNAGQLTFESGPPAGDKAAAPGVTVTLLGTGLDTVTGGDGFFQIDGAAPGFYTLEADGAPPIQTPVTVLRDNTIHVGNYLFSRVEALSLVLSLAGLDANEEFRPWLLQSPHHPLPVGTVITPALGNEEGDNDPALYLRLDAPKWFVFQNSNATLRWAHAVKYWLVDPITGAAESFDRHSYPMINGVAYYGAQEIDIDTADTAYLPNEPEDPNPVEGEKSLEILPAVSVAKRGSACCEDPKTYVLLVRGSNESINSHDIDQIKAIVNKGLIPGSTAVFSNYDSCGKKPKQKFLEKFNEVCALTRPCDTLMVYISAHGTRQGAKLEHDQFDCPQSPKLLGGSVDFDTLYADDIPWEKCAACNLIFIVDACHAGTYLRAPQVQRFNKMTGKCVAVFTAADLTHEAGAFGPIHLLRQTGSVFTNDLKGAANSQVGEAQNWDPWTVGQDGKSGLEKLFDDAKQRVANSFDVWDEFKKQNPQKFIRIAPPNETCGPSCPVTTSCTNVSAEFVVGGESCGFPNSFAGAFDITITDGNITLQQQFGDTTTGTIDAEGNFSTMRGDGGATYSGTFDRETCSGSAAHTYMASPECTALYNVFFSGG